jgi:hypothetical protein
MEVDMQVIITSAFDFLKKAHELKNNRKHASGIEFYRGQPNRGLSLLPTIFRSRMLQHEEDIINEFIRRRPDEFPERDGLFNILAKMQHYGLHTRLLDVTENPVVCLYFTCSQNLDKDGEIFIFKKDLDEIPSNAALNIITEFYINHRNNNGDYDIVSYYDYALNNYKSKDVEIAFHHIVNGLPCFARPKIINERILRQSGSFMLFANDVCPGINCPNESCADYGTDNCAMDGVATNLRERVKTVKIKNTLPDITNAHVANEQNRYRYIVKAESKKTILSELQTIGIDKAFLFPELGNDALDIMEDYCLRGSFSN